MAGTLPVSLRVDRKQVRQRRRKADGPLPQRDIGKHFIGQQARCFRHPTGATAGAEPALLAGKCHQPRFMLRHKDEFDDAMFGA